MRLKDALIGKIGNFGRGADTIRTGVWNNTVELTTTAVEIETAKPEEIQSNAKESYHLSQEGVCWKNDSNGTGAIDDNSTLAAAGLTDVLSDEESNGAENRVFTAR